MLRISVNSSWISSSWRISFSVEWIKHQQLCQLSQLIDDTIIIIIIIIIKIIIIIIVVLLVVVIVVVVVPAAAAVVVVVVFHIAPYSTLIALRRFTFNT